MLSQPQLYISYTYAAICSYTSRKKHSSYVVYEQHHKRNISSSHIPVIFYSFYSHQSTHLCFLLYFCRSYLYSNVNKLHLNSNNVHSHVLFVQLFAASSCLIGQCLIRVPFVISAEPETRGQSHSLVSRAAT